MRIAVVKVKAPLNEHGTEYQPGHEFATSVERAERLASLGLVEIVNVEVEAQPHGLASADTEPALPNLDRAMPSPVAGQKPKRGRPKRTA